MGGFALSKLPHLRRAYLVTVPEYLSFGVHCKYFDHNSVPQPGRNCEALPDEFIPF